MSRQRLFYFATEREAAGAKRLLGAHECVACGLYRCSQRSQGYLKVGGMGILAAAASTAYAFPHWDEIWNFGIAATLSTTMYPLETRVTVGSVMRPHFFPNGLEARSREWYSRLFPTLHFNHGARLVSCDYPIHQPHLAEELRAQADLLDMEGYGLVFTAQQLSKSCWIGKWITDCASTDGPLAIQRLLDRSSEQFAQWLDELLQNPPSSFSPLVHK